MKQPLLFLFEQIMSFFGLRIVNCALYNCFHCLIKVGYYIVYIFNTDRKAD